MAFSGEMVFLQKCLNFCMCFSFSIIVKHSSVFFGWCALVSKKNKIDLVTFSGQFFFLQKCPNLLKRVKKGKKFPLVPNTVVQRTTNVNAVVAPCCIHCAHFDTVLVFLRNKVQTSQKCFTTYW